MNSARRSDSSRSFPGGIWHEPADSTGGPSAPVLDDFIVVLVLVGLVVDDLQDLDEAEGGPQPSQDRLLVGVELGHGGRSAIAAVARRAR